MHRADIGRLANVSARKVTVATVPTRTLGGGAQHLDPSRKSRPGGQLPGFEACFCLCLALQELGFGTTACLGCWGSRQRIIYIYLKRKEGRKRGKEEEREIIPVEQLGLDLTSQLFSEAGITVSILQMRSQGSKQVSKLTKTTASE